MLRLFVLMTGLALTAAFPAWSGSEADLQPHLDQLAQGDWIQQTRALEQLARTDNDSAVPAIRQMLQDNGVSAYVRGRALIALARIDGGKAVGDAQAFSSDKEAHLRAAAAEAFGYCDRNAASGPLTKLIKDADRGVAIAAVSAWAKLYGKEAWAVVDPATQPYTDPKRSAEEHRDLARTLIPAMHALAHTGTPEAHERIDAIYKLHHRDNHRRERLLRGLATSGQANALTIAASYVHQVHRTGKDRHPGKGPQLPDSPEYRSVMSAIQSDGLEAVEATVRALLKSEDKLDHVLACSMAAHLMPSPEAGDLLLKVCGSTDDADVELACAQALMVPAMQPPRYQDHFTELLKSKHAASRVAGIDGLVFCPEVNRFEAYATIIEGGDAADVLIPALEQLLSAPAEQAPRQQIAAYLATAMADKDLRVRTAAANLLKQVATQRDYAAVAKDWEALLHSKDPLIRGSARLAIAAIAPEDARTELAHSDGFITQWQVIGTFIAEEDPEKTPAYPPEKELDFEKTYQAQGIFAKPQKNNKPETEKRSRPVEWVEGQVTSVEGVLRISNYVSPPSRQAVARLTDCPQPCMEGTSKTATAITPAASDRRGSIRLAPRTRASPA